MHTPCQDCPFRTDIDFYLSRDRREEIAEAVILGDEGFVCHRTIKYRGDRRIHTKNESPCIGAIKMIGNVRGDCRASLYVRLAHMVGKINLDTLSDQVEVFSTVQAFIER